jgi:hypothetical protein
MQQLILDSEIEEFGPETSRPAERGAGERKRPRVSTPIQQLSPSHAREKIVAVSRRINKIVVSV